MALPSPGEAGEASATLPQVEPIAPGRTGAQRTKRSIGDLAVFGGPAAVADPLHVGRPNIGDKARLLQRLSDALDRRWLTNDGPLVREFEEAIAAQAGVKHCLATSNGTLALELAVRATGMHGAAVTPSFTFVATTHALAWQGITPVFCDIEALTHLLDPAKVEAAVTAETTGIVAVHLWGQPCDIPALTELAARKGLKLIFDAAHAFGSAYDGRAVGSFGDAEIFSFHATKLVNSFEGGAIVTNDDDLAASVRLTRNFGFSGVDTVECVGTNAKMSEASAAMGLTTLEALPRMVALNRSNHERYDRALTGLPGIRLLRYDPRHTNNFQYVVVEVDEALSAISRDDLVMVLSAENVLVRRYFYPGCHRMDPYRSAFARQGGTLPVTNQVSDRVMVMPTGEAVTGDLLESACDVIRFVVAHGGEIAERLAKRGECEPPR